MFNLGMIDLLVKELVPFAREKGKVMSLARHGISTPPAIVKRYLENKAINTQIDGYGWDVMMTSKELFKCFQFEHYDDVDFTAKEGCSLVHDLNMPIAREYTNNYDLVFEVGTIEHVFDMKSVFSNIVSMLKVGGTVFHCSPLSPINHGFYNFSPTIFHDVYRCNGFTDFHFFIVNHPQDYCNNHGIVYKEIDYSTKEYNISHEPDAYLMLAFMAKKAHDVTPFCVPTQAFYDKNFRRPD